MASSEEPLRMALTVSQGGKKPLVGGGGEEREQDYIRAQKGPWKSVRVHEF